MANGAVIMSNFFLSSALITLAKISTGCDPDDDECDGQVYGFKPSSLISLIATVTGILSAFLLPVIGAIVDYTKYRKEMGVAFAAFLIAIQATQIATYEATWFPMAILQAINGFNYQALTLAAYAYIPEIRRAVGEETMTVYTARFYTYMFGSEALFLAIVVGITLPMGASDVLTGQIGQGVNVVMSGSFYALASYYFTKKEPMRQLSEGTSLVWAGFKQVCITSKGIVEHYPKTLTWFLLGVVFAEAGKDSFCSILITLLGQVCIIC